MRQPEEQAVALRAACDRAVRQNARFVAAIRDYRSKLVEVLELGYTGYVCAVFASLRNPTRDHRILMNDTVTTTLSNLETTFNSVYSANEKMIDMALPSESFDGEGESHAGPSGAGPSTAGS